MTDFIEHCCCFCCYCLFLFSSSSSSDKNTQSAMTVPQSSIPLRVSALDPQRKPSLPRPPSSPLKSEGGWNREPHGGELTKRRGIGAPGGTSEGTHLSSVIFSDLACSVPFWLEVEVICADEPAAAVEMAARSGDSVVREHRRSSGRFVLMLR